MTALLELLLKIIYRKNLFTSVLKEINETKKLSWKLEQSLIKIGTKFPKNCHQFMFNHFHF